MYTYNPPSDPLKKYKRPTRRHCANFIVKGKNKMIIYTTNDLINLLKISRLTIYKDIKKGKLKGNKIGNKWIFTEEQVKNYITGHKTTP